MAKVETSLVIDRLVEDVFAYVVDPENTAKWAGPVVEATQTSDGPVGLGTTSSRVTQFLGRTIEATYEITEFEPNRSYADKTTSGPVQISARISFAQANGSTKVTFNGEIAGSGFFKMAEPILGRIAGRQLASDAQTLKDLLEAQ